MLTRVGDANHIDIESRHYRMEMVRIDVMPTVELFYLPPQYNIVY